MWIAQLVIKHDCLIGNKCEKYGVSTISVPFNLYMDKNTTCSPELHTLWGEERNIKRFISALKKDKNLKHIEVDGNKVFLIEVTKKTLPVTIRAKLQDKILWIKPIHINTRGEEFWEIASWDKEAIIQFINKTKKICKYVNLNYVKQTKLKDIYYTRFLPKLSLRQKEAITLAFNQGYYDWPKKTDFQLLSKKMNISVSSYREHLKKAEKKLLPDLIKQLN